MMDQPLTNVASLRTTTAADHSVFHTLLQDWAEAIVANDAERIASFVEPDWELVTPEAGPVPLARFLDAVRSGTLTHTQMSFEVLSVRRHGDVAVVVARGTNRGEFNGEAFVAEEWATEYFVQRGDHWRCALSSLTPTAGT
jgi:ketosteroid isomerase-like protein